MLTGVVQLKIYVYQLNRMDFIISGTEGLSQGNPGTLHVA
jgi:hypothetical protein